MLLPPSEPRVLLPVPRWEWREPSQAQPKDQFGNQDRTRFVLELWTRDGGLADRFVFEDRDEFDRALYRHLIEEPNPWLVPMWAVVSFLTGTSASNQGRLVPADWNIAANQIELIASAGSGGTRKGANSSSTQAVATGGGGGAYSSVTNLNLTPGDVSPYRLSAGGAGVSSTTANTTSAGNPGADAWFNGLNLASSSVGAKGGSAGAGGTSAQNGGAGGDAASGTGSVKTSGGRGGNTTGAFTAQTGGGGAGGPTSNGSNGGDAASAISTSGGNGGTPNGGAGSANVSSPGGTSSAGGAGEQCRSRGWERCGARHRYRLGFWHWWILWWRFRRCGVRQRGGCGRQRDFGQWRAGVDRHYLHPRVRPPCHQAGCWCSRHAASRAAWRKCLGSTSAGNELWPRLTQSPSRRRTVPIG